MPETMTLEKIMYNAGLAVGEAIKNAYQLGYADAMDSVKAAEIETIEEAAEKEQAGEDAAETETAEPAAQETFDPKAFIHAGNGKTETVCGIQIDHSIEVIQMEDPNAGKVNCPKCLAASIDAAA